ncbi:MAG: ABC transporter substrate-binding protein [Gammaproteobacteria bacterium]
MRLGTNVWPGYEPLYLARGLGYLDPDVIALVEYGSASEVIRAFRNKSIEAAALTLDEVLLLLQHEIPVQVILVTDVSNGGDVLLAAPGITGFSQLRGRRVGVEASALGAYVISRALEKNELSLEDITVVPLEVAEHESAYKNRRIDAIVTFEPARTRLLAMGMNELFSSKEIPGEIVDVLVVRRNYLDEYPQRAEHVAHAWFAALDYLNRYPRDAAQRMSTRLRMSTDEVLMSYRGLRLPDRQRNLALLGGPSPGGLIPVTARLQDVMLSKQLLRTELPIDALFTGAYVRPHNQ